MPKIQKEKPSIFARRLVQLRKSRQLTQVELAAKIGVSKATIGYYEAAAKNPKLDTIQKVADFFDVPVQELVTEKSETAKPGPDSKLQTLFERVERLSPAKQRAITNMLEAYLNS